MTRATIPRRVSVAVRPPEQPAGPLLPPWLDVDVSLVPDGLREAVRGQQAAAEVRGRVQEAIAETERLLAAAVSDGDPLAGLDLEARLVVMQGRLAGLPAAPAVSAEVEEECRARCEAALRAFLGVSLGAPPVYAAEMRHYLLGCPQWPLPPVLREADEAAVSAFEGVSARGAQFAGWYASQFKTSVRAGLPELLVAVERMRSVTCAELVAEAARVRVLVAELDAARSSRACVHGGLVGLPERFVSSPAWSVQAMVSELRR